MIKTYKIESFIDVQTLHELATNSIDHVAVFDANGSNANAKSILGLMSLSYIEPIAIECENATFFTHIPFVEQEKK
jgi:hypothetical protein